jgi:redox-sensitive bicupin YhaK (pirin superfamily)
MDVKPLERIVAPGQPHFVGDGFRVHTFIPGGPGLEMERLDPFIMLDYNPRHVFAPTERPRGVGVHPHRGFETVTVALRGRIAHHDSAGGGGVIGEGGVQWMTAGSGVLHKEYHEAEFARAGGDFHMIQLWVNLPAAKKMTPPNYQALDAPDIPVVALDGNAGAVAVIAGEFAGTRGAASTHSPVDLWRVTLHPGGALAFTRPSHWTVAVLVAEGSIAVHGQHEVPVDHFAVFARAGEEVVLKAGAAGAQVLVLAGEPLRDPIAAHGPFVMNTRQELIEAFADFQAGKFGVLAD